MGLDHPHGNVDDARHLGTALVLVAGFAVVEGAAGWWTGSLALLADAGHMISDAGALGVALVASRLARRPPDARRTMGWRRAEVLGATANAALLLALAVMIAVEAAGRLRSPVAVAAVPMAIVAAVGLVVNGVVAVGLSRTHARSINLRAALLHVKGDLLASLGAVVAALAILVTGWHGADALAGLAIAAILLVGALRILREAADVLMHATPPGIDLDGLREALLGAPGVREIHDLHLWSLVPGSNVLSVHVVLDDGEEPQQATLRLQGLVRGMVALDHLTIQVEVGDARCGSPAPARHA